MIIRFKNEQEYHEWLSHESYGTREKAKRFTEKFPNTIPVVLVVDAYTPQGGEWAPAYIFIHPRGEEVLKWVVD